MSRAKHIAIIGATSAIAEHSARLWLQEDSIKLTLVARDAEKLARVSTDLKVRQPSAQIDTFTLDFLNPQAIAAFVDSLFIRDFVDIVLIAHGSLPNQTECQSNLKDCQDAILVNGLSPIMFAEAFAKHMQAANRGTVAIISSVAGDRGRQSNYIYGAAKGMLARFAEGLSHRLASTQVKVVLVKPGPTSTPMTAHLLSQGQKMASVDSVALAVVNAVNKGKLVAYAPAKWAIIMLVIRHIPNFIFKKLKI